MSNMDNPNKVRNFRIMATVAIAIGAITASPFAYAFFATILGAMAGLAAFAVIALILVFLPYLAMRKDNELLAAQKAEARRRPIETLQRMAMTAGDDLSNAEKCAAACEAENNVFETTLIAHRKEFPDDTQVIQGMESTLANMKVLATTLRENIKQGYADLEMFKREIRKAVSQERLDAAANRAAECFGKVQSDTYLNSILADEAIVAVRDTMARTMSNVNSLALQVSQRNPAVTYQPTMEMPVIQSNSYQTVSRG